jgi:hypothetical protein
MSKSHFVSTMTTISLTFADILAAVRQRQGFDKGRGSAAAVARARLAPATAAVRRLLDVDMVAGNTARGRAGRISKRLRPSLRSDLSPASHRRWIARILSRLMK